MEGRSSSLLISPNPTATQQAFLMDGGGWLTTLKSRLITTKLAYEKNIPFFCYSNGDAGIDMALAAIKKAIAETGIMEDRRSTFSHSFFAREDQLDDYKSNHIIAIT
jgi:predicted amidohydrolase YtcJ